jgi:hypothetical protein
LEVSVCNNSKRAFEGGFAADISTPNGSAKTLFEDKVKPMSCVSVYALESEFATFGITEPGMVNVHVEVSAADLGMISYDEIVDVVQIPVSTNPSALSGLVQCHTFLMGRDCIHPNRHDPIPALDEIKKQSGRHIAITAREHENISGFLIADMAICEKEIGNYLGIPSPRPVLAQLIIKGDYIGYFYTAGMGLSLINNDAQYLKRVATEEISLWRWKNALEGHCSQAHEITHSFVTQTPIPYWLNEGLADYFSHPDRSNWIEPSHMKCTETQFARDGRTYENYQPLETTNTNNADRAVLYGTAECFWTYFEETYGHNAFQQVMQLLHAQTDQNDLIGYLSYCEASGKGDISFLKTFVEPVIGEDISTLTQERFGFGNSYGACDF